ncbi:MAG: hypothetical protein HYV76_01370 [Candidatus Vogelbacteria bacterium]|nr:hypothetical protein [Candidatus Vogelbacteria bacterium]
MWRFILVGSVFLILIGGFFINTAVAAPLDLSGWAWSSNIGWISFNSANSPGGSPQGFKVQLLDVDANGNRPLVGYAWSSNIGWIKFDSFLSGPTIAANDSPFPARLTNTGLITGWTRACSILSTNCSGVMIANTSRGGWDGWIKMSGINPNYGANINLQTGIGSGMAWGSDIVGWIDFSRVRLGVLPVPGVTLVANPTSVNLNNTTQLTWTATNVSSCLASGGWSGVKSIAGGVETSVPLITNTTFSISCVPTAGGPNVTASANVTVTTPGNGCDDPDGCPPDGGDNKTLTVKVIGDSTISGKASGSFGECTSAQSQCSFNIRTNTSISIAAIITSNFTPEATITWSGNKPSSCTFALGVNRSDCTGILMDRDRTIIINFNDDDVLESAELTVSYDSLTRKIKATGINVGSTNPQSEFRSTIAKVLFSSSGVTEVSLNYDAGSLTDISDRHLCSPVNGKFDRGVINSGQTAQFQVIFLDRCSATPTTNSYYSIDNTNGDFPIYVIANWNDSAGNPQYRAVTIPLQYTENITNQP